MPGWSTTVRTLGSWHSPLDARDGRIDLRAAAPAAATLMAGRDGPGGRSARHPQADGDRIPGWSECPGVGVPEFGPRALNGLEAADVTYVSNGRDKRSSWSPWMPTRRRILRRWVETMVT